jgi:HSP20 family protein
MVDKDVPIAMGTGEEEGIEENKTPTESVLADIVNTIKDKQEELGKSLSEYTMSFQKPLVDIMETDDSIIVISDLPGVKKENIEIDISEDTIEIVAKFDEEIEEEGANYLRKERSYGETRRSMVLPAKIEVKKAKAKFKDSVLTVELPKIKEAKHKVEIK